MSDSQNSKDTTRSASSRGTQAPLATLGSEKFGEASRAVPSRGSQLSTPSVEEANPVLVQQVFGLFKSYLNTQLEEKGKQIELKNKIEKDMVELKFKGNQKQFKLNAQLNSILDQIQSAANPPDIPEINKLVAEGKTLIHKRQKLIKIADRNEDGWLVVNEYESDDLASGSEDEKKLRKAKESASRKRKAKFDGRRNEGKKPKYAPDNQIFRGECSLVFAFRMFTLSLLFGFCLGESNHILVVASCVFYWVFKSK